MITSIKDLYTQALDQAEDYESELMFHYSTQNDEMTIMLGESENEIAYIFYENSAFYFYNIGDATDEEISLDNMFNHIQDWLFLNDYLINIDDNLSAIFETDLKISEEGVALYIVDVITGEDKTEEYQIWVNDGKIIMRSEEETIEVKYQ